jgi:hypothetical protein
MRKTWLSLSALALCQAASAALAQSPLAFTLPGDLKTAGCGGDDDGDCLDNLREAQLAFAVAPHYFYDEDESCAGAPYLSSKDPLHFGRRDFFQVRPAGGDVAAWTTSGAVKAVRITYFLLHPHDCQSHVGFGGHQGDSEHVRFRLESTDLKTWTLVSGEYNHHGKTHTFSGQYLAARAGEIGTAYPSIAADEDGHGSWPGRLGSSTHCAGSEDDFCLGFCDCFSGTMAAALAGNKWEFVGATKNVGGPSPEKFRPAAVTVSGASAFSKIDTGHGLNAEYWTPRTDSFKTFCGWECSSRTADGNCNNSIHGKTKCVSPLSNKTDKSGFTNSSSAAAASGPPGAPAALLAPEALFMALAEIPTLAGEDLESWQLELLSSGDPVGLLVPMLAGEPAARQEEALWWLLELPGGKAEAALTPELFGAELDGEARRVLAEALLGSLAVSIESADGPDIAGPASPEAAGCAAAPLSGERRGWRGSLFLLFSAALLVVIARRHARGPARGERAGSTEARG